MPASARGLARLACAFTALAPARALDNGVGRTPARGWLSWERFACTVDCAAAPNGCISERLYMEMADAMVAGGWRDAGYEYVDVDDCWLARARDASGRLAADPERFPSGIRALADYVHARGLKLGLYTDVGATTCEGYPALDVPVSGEADVPSVGASRGYAADLALLASWGIDPLKVDGCNQPTDHYAVTYPRVSRALNATGRAVLLSCSWPAYMQARARTAATRREAPAPLPAATCREAPAPLPAATRREAPAPLPAATRREAPAPLPAATRREAPAPLLAATRSQAPAPLPAATRREAPAPLLAATRREAPAPLPAATRSQAPAPPSAATRREAPAPCTAATHTHTHVVVDMYATRTAVMFRFFLMSHDNFRSSIEVFKVCL